MCVCVCVYVYRVPEEARPADYRGPKRKAYKLSETDKKYIVKFYSDLHVGQGIYIIHVCMAYSRIYTVIHVTKKVFSIQMVMKAMKM